MFNASVDGVDLLEYCRSDIGEEFNADGKSVASSQVCAMLRGTAKATDGSLFPPRVIRIKKAIIHDKLDLRDCHGPDATPLPALALEDCTFLAGIDISNAHLTRLSLKNSKFTYLDGRSCRIVSDLDVSHVESSGSVMGAEAADGWHIPPRTKSADGSEAEAPQSSEVKPKRPQPLCHVNLRGARLGGSLLAVGAVLVAPAEGEAYDQKEYALDLRGARIEGGIQFFDKAAALGGVNLPSVIGGTVYMAGAKLVAVAGSALDGQQAKISGFVGLRTHNSYRFEAEGDVDFLLAQVRGGFDLSEAKLTGSNSTLSLVDVTSEGRLGLGGVETNAVIHLENLKIGEIHCSSGPIDAQDIFSKNLRVAGKLQLTGKCQSLDLSRAEVGGDIIFGDEDQQQFSASEVVLDNAVCAGKLTCSKASLGKFRAEHLRVDNDFSFEGDLASPLDLRRAMINGNLEIKRVALGFKPFMQRQGSEEVPAPSIVVDDASVKGRLILGDVRGPTDSIASDLRNRASVIAARFCRLPWLPNVELVEILTTTRHGLVQASLLKSKRPPLFLYQSGQAILSINHDNGLIVSSTHAAAYLKFFCSYIVAEQGSFELVDPNSPPAAEPLILNKVKAVTIDREMDDQGRFRGSATVQYAGYLFNATFAISPNSGSVEMLDDEPLSETAAAARFVPLGRGGGPQFKLIGSTSADEWMKQPSTGHPAPMKKLSVKTAADILCAAIGPPETHIISLTNASVGTVGNRSVPLRPNDIDVRLKVSGLSLTRTDWIDTGKEAHHIREKLRSKDEKPSADPQEHSFNVAPVFVGASTDTSDRAASPTDPYWYRTWLELQHSARSPDPQPYEELIRLYQGRGEVETANEIIRLRHAAMHPTLRFGYRTMSTLWSGLFGLGLNWWHPLLTFGVCLILVYFAGLAADTSGALTRPVAEATQSFFTGTTSRPSQSCGPFNSFAFAVERFVPLLDLREQRCTIADNAWGWRSLFILVTFLGWLIIPLAIYSITRAVRLQFERSAE